MRGGSSGSCASITTRLDAGLTLRRYLPLMWIHASRAYSLVSKETFERERCWKRSWTQVPQPITKHQKSRSDPFGYTSMIVLPS